MSIIASEAEKQRRAVDRGAALLDRQCPGWASKISLQRLDLSNSCQCVLGQVFKDYYYGGVAFLGLEIDGGFLGLKHPSRYGFALTKKQHDNLSQRNAYWSALTEEWINYLMTRHYGREEGAHV